MAEASNGINFMAMLNPQFAATQQKFALQQAMAQQMMQEGSQQPSDNQLANPGGMIVQNSPLGGAARGIEKALGAYLANKNIDNQMAAYQNLNGQQTANQSLNGQSGSPLLPWQNNAATGQQQGQAVGNAMIGGGNNPTAMEMFQPNERLGNTMYENRMAAQKAAAVAGAEAPYKTVTLPDGSIAPLTSVIHPPAQPNMPSPQSPPMAAPQASQMNDLYGANAETPSSPSLNATPNVIPGTTPGVPAVNPNSAAGAANAAGLKAGAVKYGETAADTQKNLDAMTSKLPLVLSRLDTMRKAAPDASFGYGVDNQGEGAKQDIHDQLGDKVAKANNTLLQLSAQGVLPELGPQLQGMKGNKFLESLAASSSGLNMKAPSESKLELINGLQKNYIGMIKSTAQQMRDMGQKAPSDAEIEAMVAKSAPQQIPTGVTHVWTPQGIKPVGGQ